jgi:hypothetical protein
MNSEKNTYSYPRGRRESDDTKQKAEIREEVTSAVREAKVQSRRKR